MYYFLIKNYSCIHLLEINNNYIISNLIDNLFKDK